MHMCMYTYINKLHVGSNLCRMASSSRCVKRPATWFCECRVGLANSNETFRSSTRLCAGYCEACACAPSPSSNRLTRLSRMYGSLPLSVISRSSYMLLCSKGSQRRALKRLRVKRRANRAGRRVMPTVINVSSESGSETGALSRDSALLSVACPWRGGLDLEDPFWEKYSRTAMPLVRFRCHSGCRSFSKIFVLGMRMREVRSKTRTYSGAWNASACLSYYTTGWAPGWQRIITSVCLCSSTSYAPTCD